MAISIVQTPVNFSGGSATLGSPVQSSGSCLVAVLGSTFNPETWTLSDGVNGAWAAALLNTNHFGSIQAFAFASAGGGSTTVTATEGTGGKLAQGVLFEVAGLASTNGTLLDKSATGFASGSTTPSTGTTGTTTNANELAIAAFMGNASQTWTAGSGYTLVSTATQQFACEYQILSSTGTQVATATTLVNVSCDTMIFTLNPAGIVAASIAAFNAVLP